MEASLNTDPAVIALEPTKNQLRAFAAGLVIHSHEGYEQAALQLKTIKSALADIEAARVRITGPLNWALKETNNQAKAASLPFAQDEQTIKVAMVTYSNEQDRLRQEEQRRQNEAAARQRARLQAIADAAAQKARDEAAERRRQAEEAERAGRMEEANKLAEQAERVELRGAQKQEQFESRAQSVVAPVAQQAAPKVGGIKMQEVWEFEIESETLIPREYLSVNEAKIRKVVGALKGDCKIPGVRVFPKNRIAAGRA